MQQPQVQPCSSKSQSLVEPPSLKAKKYKKVVPGTCRVRKRHGVSVLPPYSSAPKRGSLILETRDPRHDDRSTVDITQL